jgi:hypothetical protein
MKMLSDTVNGRLVGRRSRVRQTTEVLTVIGALALFFCFGWMLLLAMV